MTWQYGVALNVVFIAVVVAATWLQVVFKLARGAVIRMVVLIHGADSERRELRRVVAQLLRKK